MKVKPTIEDIAKKTNFSITAVSFALNKKKGVSKKTSDKILQVARELNYSIPQQKLGKQRIKILKIVKHGQILNEDHQIFISGYLNGIEESCQFYEDRIELVTYNQIEIEKIVKEVIQDETTGAIIIATELDEYDILKFSEVKKDLCFIDANYNFLPFSFVNIDNINSVYSIIEYLKSKGHQEIGMVASSYPTPNFKERETGFQLSLEKLGLKYNPKFTLKISPRFSEGVIDAAKEIETKLSTFKHFPSALFCINDIIAYATLRGLRKKNIRVPHDISLVGFDDLPASQICEPALTTMKVPTYQIGIRAHELLLLNRKMRLNIEKFSERVTISGNLIERDSVKMHPYRTSQ